MTLVITSSALSCLAFTRILDKQAGIVSPSELRSWG